MSFTGRVNRKARADRNHAIYLITNRETNDSYIGMTFVRPPTAKKHTRGKMPMISVQSRFKSHCYRAENGSPDRFHSAIRSEGIEAFRVEILEIVRGKKSAHKREMELIRQRRPTYNMIK
jgi:predicted GIY-YIG superfamily endonuclease